MGIITKNKPFVYENTSYSGADITAVLTISPDSNLSGGMITLGDIQTLSYSTHMERGVARTLGNTNIKDFTSGPRTIAGSLVFAVFNRHMIYKIIEATGIDKTHILTDELPPFDITVSAASEYGYQSVMRILGIRLVNEGKVMSINDIYTENTYQYMARDIIYLNREEDANALKYPEPSYEKPPEESLFRDYSTDVSSIAKLKASYVTNATSITKGCAILQILNAADSTNYLINVYKKVGEASVKMHTYLLTSDNCEVILYLEPAQYYATLSLEKNETAIISTTYFSILYNDTTSVSLKEPLITNVTSNSISGINQEDTAVQMICKSESGTINALDLVKNNTFVFNNLLTEEQYEVYCIDKDNHTSMKVLVTTDDTYTYTNYEAFYEFILANQNIMGDAINYLDDIYNRLVHIAATDHYMLSITRYLISLKSLHLPIDDKVFEIYAKQANIFEIYSKIGKENYTLSIEDHYHNIIVACNDIKDIYLLNSTTNKRTELTQINSSNRYAFSAPEGFYYIIQINKNNTIEQLEYYIAPDDVNQFFSNDIFNATDEYEIFYNRYHNYTYNKTDYETVLAYLNQKILSTGVALTFEGKDDTRLYFNCYDISGQHSDCYIVFDTLATVFKPLTGKIKYALHNQIFFSLNYKNSCFNENEIYFVYLADSNNQLLSQAFLLNLQDLKIDHLSKELIQEDIEHYSNTLQHLIEINLDNGLIDIVSIANQTFLDIMNESLSNKQKYTYLKQLVTLKYNSLYVRDASLLLKGKVIFTPTGFSIYSEQNNVHIIMEFYDQNGFNHVSYYSFNRELHAITGDSLYVSFCFEKNGFISQNWLVDLTNKTFEKGE